MKRIIFVLTVGCVFAISSYAADTILVNDTWADGDRTSTGPDGAFIDSAWFAASTSTISVPAAGTLRGSPTSSATWQTYFAPSGTPVTLADGETLKVTWVFTPSSISAGNTGQGFNLAVALSPTHVVGDGSPANQVFAGYAQFMNMGAVLGNANPFALREWVNASAGSLLGTAGNWGANGASGASLATAGFSGDTGYLGGQYTYVMSLTRSGTSMLITSTMSGNVEGGAGLSVSTTDASANTFSFDTFEIRPNASSQAAGQFDTSNFKVEYITADVPEPATFALAGLGVLGLVLVRRMRR